MKFAAAALAALAGAIPTLAANITVVVGDGGLTFNPQVVNAAVGDFVNFEFRGGNHTVTQSSFASTSSSPYQWR
jgi:plastocyanin